AALGLLRAAAHRVDGASARRQGVLGATEATLVLGSLVILLGAFSATQLVALTGSGQRVLRTQGLTYSQYARRGFFQLMWAATVTGGVVVAVRAAVMPAVARAPRLKQLASVVLVLTMGLAVVAIRRLLLYDDAFGM